MLPIYEEPAYKTQRLLGFAAAGVPISQHNAEEGLRSLDAAPQYAGQELERVRQVLAVIAAGVLPSQQHCLEARVELKQLCLQHRERRHQELVAGADEQPSDSPRGG